MVDMAIKKGGGGGGVLLRILTQEWGICERYMRNWTFRNFQNQTKPYSAVISFGNFDLFSNFLLTKATKGSL